MGAASDAEAVITIASMRASRAGGLGRAQGFSNGSIATETGFTQAGGNRIEVDVVNWVWV
jgi:hypothetical protein